MSHKKLYSKLFTPPKFLEMPSVSLDISPEGISFMSTKATDKGLIPAIFDFMPLPPNTLYQGEVLKREVVIKALFDIKKRTKVSFVRLSLPEEKTYIFKTHLPKLSTKEIRDILDFKIEENVPLLSKEAVFDYDIIPTPKESEGLDLVVSVAPLKLVEELQDLFEIAGLIPIFFSPESQNVARAVIKENNQQVIVIANIKKSSIVLSLVVCGIVIQTSSLNFGSSVFDDLLAKYFKVPLEELMKLKKEKLYNENTDNMEIFSYLINTFSALKDELYKFISYCNEGKEVSDQVDKVILCGTDALIVGLDKYLAMNLDMKVEIANIWTNNFNLDDYIPPHSRLESMNLAVVNGLSLF